jgi:hypothetical protein
MKISDFDIAMVFRRWKIERWAREFKGPPIEMIGACCDDLNKISFIYPCCGGCHQTSNFAPYTVNVLGVKINLCCQKHKYFEEAGLLPPLGD